MLSNEGFSIDIELHIPHTNETTTYLNFNYSSNPECTFIRVNRFMEKFISSFNFSLDENKITIFNPCLNTFTKYSKTLDFYTLNVEQLPKSDSGRPLINLVLSPLSADDIPTKKRGPEKTIGEIHRYMKKLEKIEARDIHNALGKHQKLSKLSRIFKVRTRTLQKYEKCYRLAKAYDFNFKLNSEEKFRFMTSFVMRKQQESLPEELKDSSTKLKALQFLQKRKLALKMIEKEEIYYRKLNNHSTIGEAYNTVKWLNELMAGKLDEETGVVVKAKTIYEAAKIMNVQRNFLYGLTKVIKCATDAGFDFEKHKDLSVKFLKKQLDMENI